MKKLAILFVAVLALLTSCDKGFDDMNTSTTSLTTVTPNLLFNSLVHNGVCSDYQRNQNLYDDPYSHYFANTVKSFKTENYEYNDSWAVTGWTAFYTGRLKEYNDIAAYCKGKSAYTNFMAATEIYTCFLWQRMTDKYGALPYTDASKGTAVAYTEQSKIYLDLLSRVKLACESINESDEVQYNPASYDLLYGGDYGKWKRFGYSLLLRMSMRISKVDATNAQTYAKAALAGGTFNSNGDIAKMKLDMVNGWYDYLNNTLINWQGGCISLSFCDYMRGATSDYSRADGLDPRASRWITPGTLGYVGFKNGLAASSYPSDYNWANYANINYTDAGFFYNEGSDADRLAFPIMNYAETLFLKSEAALRGWYTGESAESLYLQGIKASMNEVSSVSTEAITSDEIDEYIAGLPTWSGASSKEDKFKLISVQNWLATFPNGAEGWSIIRRTGYPTDLSYPDVSSNARVKNNNWVERVCYPNNEHDYNSASLPSTLNSYSSDMMDICNWWAQKNSAGNWPKGSKPDNGF
jgi:hypothetical protein